MNARTRAKADDARTHEWLMGRSGNRREPRIETLSWGRLAKMFYASRPNSQVRRAILAECRRCGYTPRVILGIHAND
jgi:hypothetical protein